MCQGTPKQFKKAQKLSTKQGWTWEQQRGSLHVVVRDANGDFVCTVSTTMYDGVLTKKILSVLRKRGCPGA